MSVKSAPADHTVHVLVAERWSPYGFDAGRPVADEDLKSLFEAARWAPSAYNEQPWRYIVARRADSGLFEEVLSCLVEGNRVWASFAPVLALGVASRRFSRNGRENGTALHDLGLASANLLVEATSRGLLVHQMSGIHPGRARELFGIPEGFDAVTGIAIGHPGRPGGLPEELAARDLEPRTRNPLGRFVFGERWGEPAAFLSDGSDGSVTGGGDGDE